MKRTAIAFVVMLVGVLVSAQGPITPVQGPITTGPGGGGSGASVCTTTANSVQYANGTALGCVAGATSDGTVMTFAASDLQLAGASSGLATFLYASSATSSTLTFPVGTGTVLTTGATTLTPQFARIGLGAAADASNILTISGGANLSALVSSGTSTTSGTVAAVSVSHTLNTASAPTVFKFPVTDTAHGAGTQLFDFLGGAAGATSQLNLLLNASTSTLRINSSGAVGGYGTTADATTYMAFSSGGSGSFDGVAFHSDTGWGIYTNKDNLEMQSGGVMRWDSGAFFSSVDTGIARNAAGVVEVNSGTAGTFRSIQAVGFRGSGTTAVAVANVGANSCGTTAATIAGNNNSGIITVGATSGSQCRVALTYTAANRWVCQFQDETTANIMRPSYVDTTHVDVLGTMVAGDVINYHCWSY